MSQIKFLPLLLTLSCIDFITQKTEYNSLYFKGGSWIEFEHVNSMKLESDNFTLQFWVSGGDVDTNEAPALFSIVDSNDIIKLALFRDKGQTNIITTIINSKVLPSHKIVGLDWSDKDNFYLISFLFSNSSGVKVYLNDNNFLNVDSTIILGDAKLIVGALANEKRTLLENFWYGYIDEVRLWNTLLTDSTISFQYSHSEKLGDYYRYPYYDSLIGIWRLNFEEPHSVIEDDSGYDNDGIIYTITGYSVELSKKGPQ